MPLTDQTPCDRHHGLPSSRAAGNRQLVGVRTAYTSLGRGSVSPSEHGLREIPTFFGVGALPPKADKLGFNSLASSPRHA